MVEAGYRSNELGTSRQPRPAVKRFPRCILATTVLPWTDSYALDEALYRHQIRVLLQAGFRDLYVFGTAAEGYARR